jgi:hypothetical protein
MNRREFISLIGGSASAAWPCGGGAQQRQVPIIGILGTDRLSPKPFELLYF